MTQPPPPTKWSDHAACLGHPVDWWFAPEHQGYPAIARQICQGCPVRLKCLDWATSINDNGQVQELHGMWGGMSPEERRAIVRRRQGKAPAAIAHGTKRGYRTHRRRGEEPCDWCRAAMFKVYRPNMEGAQ